MALGWPGDSPGTEDASDPPLRSPRQAECLEESRVSEGDSEKVSSGVLITVGCWGPRDWLGGSVLTHWCLGPHYEHRPCGSRDFIVGHGFFSLNAILLKADRIWSACAFSFIAT